MDSQDFVGRMTPHLVTALHVAGLLVGRADAEDVVQEAILRAWRGWGDLPPNASERAWFLRIVLNTAHNWYRDHQRRQRAGSMSLDVALPFLSSAAEDPGSGDHTVTLDLRAAIDALEDGQRQIILLRYYADLTPHEIGEVLGIPPGTARARLRRALAALRERLQGVHMPHDISWERSL